MGIQVSSLTQGKKPWQKEFIDFQFNGKYISEFGLVAVSDGDRLTFAASPDFENETTEVNGVAGQLFWGSKIKSLKRTYNLATDGMTEAQINEFKYHFRPGQYGKFIEDKLMHRYGYCRVADVVEFKMIPFQKTIDFLGFPLKINEYKGEISITFEWDNPYMYSTINYIEAIDAPTNENFNDVARAVYNNGVPLYSSWITKFEEAARLMSRRSTGSNTTYGAELGMAILGIMFLGAATTGSRQQCHLGQDKCLEFNQNENNPQSFLVQDGGYQGSDIANEPLIYYNPSNIQTPSNIVLSFVPSFTELKQDIWEPVYINNIIDDINYQATGASLKYNSIKGTSKIYGALRSDGINCFTLPDIADYIYQFNYTNPSVLYSLNKGIKLAYDYYKQGTNLSALSLEEKIREEIVHKKVAQHLIGVLSSIRIDQDFCDQNDIFTTNKKAISIEGFGSGEITGDWFAAFNLEVLRFLYNSTSKTFPIISITFDGEKSEAKISYECEILGQKFERSEEFCGDATLSPYFNLEGGDTVDKVGNILSCHALLFQQGGSFQNAPHVQLKYKYTYL